jgi:O-antigen/teichoic acid export membrane protein
MVGKLTFKTKPLLKRHRVLLENFKYITILQIFVMLAPLITYPYLVRVLGRELYGLVITAQVIASYFTIVVNFGFREVGAKYISIYRDDKDKLSEIFSSIFGFRFALWLLSFFIYLTIIYFVPSFRSHLLLFIFSFGVTLDDLLFPQFFFQGIEKMKYTSIINIIIRAVSIALIFVFVRNVSDYYIVPLFLTIGFLIGGLISMYIIIYVEGVKLRFPKWSSIRYYTKDALPIFMTEVVCSIKDKTNYILLAYFVGMQEVVIYDFGSKLMNILVKPSSIIGTVLFPRLSKERNTKLFIKTAKLVFSLTLLLSIVSYLFLPIISRFFIPGNLDLLPIKIFLIVPVFLATSSFVASNFIIAFGYNKHMFYSIVVTTIMYIITFLLFYFFGMLNSVLCFVVIGLISYFSEFVYRLYISYRIIRKQKKIRQLVEI